jgi:hypothetical protein
MAVSMAGATVVGTVVDTTEVTGIEVDGCEEAVDADELVVLLPPHAIKATLQASKTPTVVAGAFIRPSRSERSSHPQCPPLVIPTADRPCPATAL